MKASRTLIVLLLTIAVFISGNGVVLAIHTCLSSSTKSVSLFEDNCKCSDEENSQNDGSSHVEAGCCISQYSYCKLNIPFTVKKITVLQQAVLVAVLPVFNFSFIKIKNFPTIDKTYHQGNIPVLFSQLLI